MKEQVKTNKNGNLEIVTKKLRLELFITGTNTALIEVTSTYDLDHIGLELENGRLVDYDGICYDLPNSAIRLIRAAGYVVPRSLEPTY